MKLSICIALALFSHSTFAQTFQSESQQVPLVELYTSEGCSSCPPAERWMNSLLEKQGLWQDYVPVAFHVDYWDYIGWPDRFANKQYSQRQRRYAAELNETTVYTPGMRKAGDLWRNWLFTSEPSLNNASEVGVLSLEISPDGDFTAEFDDLLELKNHGSLQISVAILGLGLNSEVTRGENHGKTLEHNFVVLGLSTFASAQQNQWQGTLPAPSSDAPAYAVAAWVSQGPSLKPIQTVGGKINYGS